MPGTRPATVVILSVAFGLVPHSGSSPAPDSSEQKKILADATDYAFNHERSLPNFLCIANHAPFSGFSKPRVSR